MSRRRASALSNRQMADQSSSVPTRILDCIPSNVKACLRRLPAAVDRFLSARGDGVALTVVRRASVGLSQEVGPLSDFLSEFCNEPASLHDKASRIAAAVLADEAVRTSLLRLVAAGVRLAPADLETGRASGAGRTALAYIEACSATSILLERVLYAERTPGLSSQVMDFVRKLLRMQTLHALSRQLAASAEVFRRSRDEALLQQPPSPLQQGAITAAAMPFCLLRSLMMVLWLVLGGRQQDELLADLYLAELAAALHDTHVMEHAARLVLLAQESGAWELGHLDVTGAHAVKAFQSACRTLANLYDLVSDSSLGFPAAVQAQLGRVLAGPCVRHAVILHGLATLCAADGGTAYGLPWLGRCCVELDHHPCMDGSRRPVPVLSAAAAVLLAIEALVPTAQTPPRGRRVALALLMRFGNMAVASGQAWAGLTRNRSSSSPGFTPTTAPDMQQLVILPRASVTEVAVKSLLAASAKLQRLQADSPARLVQEVVEWWQLVDAVLRHAMSDPGEHVQELGEVLANGLIHSLPRSIDGGSCTLPPLSSSAPPMAAAALAGGVLPCLERTFRRAGADPSGPEMALVGSLLGVGGASMALVGLLVHGEEPQAAALLVTLGKMLRSGDARDAGESAASSSSGWMAETVCQLVCDILAYSQALLESRAASVKEGTAVAAAAASGTASTRFQQALLLASCALCECLPPLSRLVQQASVARADRLLHGGSADANWMDAAQHFLAVADFWLVNIICQCLGPAATCHPQSNSGAVLISSRAAAAAAADISGPGKASWRQLLLVEVDVVALLGALLRVGANCHQPGHGVTCLARSCCAVAVAFPEQVRQAAVAAAADPAAAGWRPERLLALLPLLLPSAAAAAAADDMQASALSSGVSGSSSDMQEEGGSAEDSASSSGGEPSSGVSRSSMEQQEGRRSGGGMAQENGSSSSSSGSGVSNSSGGSSSNRMEKEHGDVPNSCTSSSSDPEGSGVSADAEAVEVEENSSRDASAVWVEGGLARLVQALAGQLEAWSSGGDQPSEEGKGAAGGNGYLDSISVMLGNALALVSPAELRVRGLLRGCGNPGCANLAGDSEAEVKLKKCGRCGAVGYCCRECQVAHWKAGHKEACGRGATRGRPDC
ncbi:hypothetical protein Agub_g6152 [Astrephomene gubernaculifera]|uniref:phytol kinase n=1 Tax=Astrephomene gubernaculifera TaxID=47775 RepID=A0AAD3DMX9_9CHLO|nr:hypothetical protein Agub_g6152 [Astrephomene gubernaculifera]